VLDAHWNLIDLNSGARRFASLLTGGPATTPTIDPDRAPFNMLDALAAPAGFSRRIANLNEVGPALVARLRLAPARSRYKPLGITHLFEASRPPPPRRSPRRARRPPDLFRRRNRWYTPGSVLHNTTTGDAK
jgi:hypothetical protein